jgi:Rad52/22 family double-strand break repair protein
MTRPEQETWYPLGAAENAPKQRNEATQGPSTPDTFAGSAAIRANLRREFSAAQVERVQKPGGMRDTVGHPHVVARLNEVVPGWTYELTRFIETHGAMVQTSEMKDGKPVMRFQLDPGGMPHLVAVYGWMEVDGVRRYEVGDVENVSRYGQELKEAISDFLKRAAMRFGVGLYLWAKQPLEDSGDGASLRADHPAETSPVQARSTGASAERAPKPAPATADSSPALASDPAAPSGTQAAGSSTSPEGGSSSEGSEGASGDLTSGEGGALSRSPVPPDRTSEGGGGSADAGSIGEGAEGDGVSPTPPDPIAKADQWALAARLLKTSKTNTQVQVVEFLKTAQTGVRQPSEVTVSLLDWAVASILTAKRAG